MALYRVNPDGRAPAGLSAGDEVWTNGGIYRITAVNADGSYQSVRVSDAEASAYSQSSRTMGGVSAQTNAQLASLEGGYTPSESVRQAQSVLDQLLSAPPAAYSSPRTGELDALYRTIENRAPFRYDLARDTLYQQYREQYGNLGRQAMTDTMSRAASLTGGYASSFSHSAGQQAYNGYLQKLNDLVPQLYREARDQYNEEGRALTDRYNLLRAREQSDYDRYRSAVTDYQRALSDARSAWQQAYSNDYRQYSDMLDYWLAKAKQENAEYWQQTKWSAKSAKSGASSGRGGAQQTQTQQPRKRTVHWNGVSAAGGGGGSAGGRIAALTR